MISLRRYITLILFITLLTTVVHSQDSFNDKFEKGVTAFTAGNYEESLDLWKELVNAGYRSANLYYNLGNAYFKLNNIPQAIIFYERAYLINPADENVNYNLQIARTMIVDRFQEIPELFFVRWYNFVSLILSSNTWAKISLVSFIIFLTMLSIYIYSTRYRVKVFGFWFAVITLVIASASLAFTIKNKELVYNSNKAIIVSPLVNGKSSPDDSGTDLFLLHEGTKVSVEDEVGEWYEIRLSDGNKGWVPINSLVII